MLLTPLSHLLGPPPPSSVTYFMDGPVRLSVVRILGLVLSLVKCGTCFLIHPHYFLIYFRFISVTKLKTVQLLFPWQTLFALIPIPHHHHHHNPWAQRP